MFEFIKKLFEKMHVHTKKIPIIFSMQYVGRNGFNQDAFNCYLHTCPDCGEMLEEGHAAEFRGERVGNFWALRRSIRLAKHLYKDKIEKQKDDAMGIRRIPVFYRESMDVYFEDTKNIHKKIPVNSSEALAAIEVDLVA